VVVASTTNHPRRGALVQEAALPDDALCLIVRPLRSLTGPSVRALATTVT